MADIRPLKLEDLGSGIGALKEFVDGDFLSIALGGTGKTNPNWMNTPLFIPGGTANDITLTAQAPWENPTALVHGTPFRFNTATTNTGAVTINVAGLGAKPCVTVTGQSLPEGYIRVGAIGVTAVYDAAGDRFIVHRVTEVISNANGLAVRFDIGVQVAFNQAVTANGNLTNALGGIFVSGDSTWTYPAAFVSTPAIVGMGGSIVTRVWAMLGDGGSTTTTGRFRAASATSIASTPGVSLIAVGRWY